MPAEPPNTPTFKMVSQIIEQLESLNEIDREHVMRTVLTWFRIPIWNSVNAIETQSTSSPQRESRSEDKFSNRSFQSVKEFIQEKKPATELERMACLAYYLTHYLERLQFKATELSQLHTEASQRKLVNPTLSTNKAVKYGFIVQSSRDGYYQLSAMGERFVQLLPERSAALKVKQLAFRRMRGTKIVQPPESRE